MTPDEHLNQSYSKILNHLMADDKDVLKAHLSRQKELACEEGFYRARLEQKIKIFFIAAGVVFALAISYGGIRSYFTIFPPTECNCLTKKEILDEYCFGPSDAKWYTGSTIHSTEFPDGTKCWKQAGSGSMSCLLP